MTDRDDPLDPIRMSAEERLAEVASILAAGVLRLRRRAALPARLLDIPAAQESPETALSRPPTRG